MLYVELPDYFIDCFSIVTAQKASKTLRDASQSKGWHLLLFQQIVITL